MNPGPIGDPGRKAACHALILAPRPPLTLSERRDRMLSLWNSIEAAKREPKATRP
jgi:hypothetical protein